jgi:hypothetical protein
VTVFLFEFQNQSGYGLSVASQNRYEDEDGVRRTSRSSSLLHLEASQARVFSLVSRLADARRGRCMWHHSRGRMELKLKMVDLIASGAGQCKSDGNTLR